MNNIKTNEGRTSSAGCCPLKLKHNNQMIQYICLDSSCLKNRLLCKQCVEESHRKHRVGIIDKLIEPLNRLNMNSNEHSHEDYNYLNQRLKAICEEWQKLNEIFYNNMKELQNGVLFQLTTVMKTFTNDQIDKAYEVLMDGDSDQETINEYVNMINFLNEKQFQDADTIKKMAEVITERVKKTISKTVKKVDILFKKMQEHIKQLDFTKYREFKECPEEEIHENSQNKSIEKNQEKELAKNKVEDEEATLTKFKADLLKAKELEHEEITNRYAFPDSYNPRRSNFMRGKK